MAMSERKILLRKYERANNGFDKAIEQLGGMRETYHLNGEEYKLYQAYIDLMLTQTVMVQKNLTEFRAKYL